jgi:hypothetical protein
MWDRDFLGWTIEAQAKYLSSPPYSYFAVEIMCDVWFIPTWNAGIRARTNIELATMPVLRDSLARVKLWDPSTAELSQGRVGLVC